MRPQLVTVPGAVVPWPFGGKQRQVMVDLNPGLLQSKGLSPQDVLTSFGNENLVLPSGTAKIDEFEYDVRMNSSPRTVAELNDLPIKQAGLSTVYLRDVANVRDGFAPQTNIVRDDGHRGVLISILKAGNASTIDVVKGIRQLLPRVAQTLPPQLKIQPLADQSDFRERSRKRRNPRGSDRGMPYRSDDSAVSGKLAKHADYRGVHSPLDSDVGDCPEPSGRDDQYHDSGRVGSCRRHSGG